jgi:hypothetical protein
VVDGALRRHLSCVSGRWWRSPAVRYRDYWFSVDDGDLKTKRAMTAVMFFFTLADTGGNERLPLITIPAQ